MTSSKIQFGYGPLKAVVLWHISMDPPSLEEVRDFFWRFENDFTFLVYDSVLLSIPDSDWIEHWEKEFRECDFDFAIGLALGGRILHSLKLNPSIPKILVSAPIVFDQDLREKLKGIADLLDRKQGSEAVARINQYVQPTPKMNSVTSHVNATQIERFSRGVNFLLNQGCHLDDPNPKIHLIGKRSALVNENHVPRDEDKIVDEHASMRVLRDLSPSSETALRKWITTQERRSYENHSSTG